MSRIHSGHKGRSGSHRPFPAQNPSWVTATREEIVEQAVRMAREGTSAARTGQIMRDVHGIPSTRLITGRRLTVLLRENGVNPEIPEDLQALLKRVVHLSTTWPRTPRICRTSGA